jgi:hypothetical protein
MTILHTTKIMSGLAMKRTTPSRPATVKNSLIINLLYNSKTEEFDANIMTGARRTTFCVAIRSQYVGHYFYEFHEKRRKQKKKGRYIHS